jgi:TonB family protein
MRRHTRFHIMAAGVIVVVSLNVSAESVKIIANSNVQTDEISALEIRSLFLQEKNSLKDGTRIEPVLERGGPTHEAFLKKFLGQNDDRLQRYYQSLVFTGKGSMPKALGSDAEVVAYVARTKGAIGYVGGETNAEGVKTLVIMSISSNTERKLIARAEPVYPLELQRHSIGGTVRLRITITPKGDVKDVQILGGNPILADSAVAAVGKWRYAAASSQTSAEISIPFNPHR